jgi:hypothetical protein
MGFSGSGVGVSRYCRSGEGVNPSFLTMVLELGSFIRDNLPDFIRILFYLWAAVEAIRLAADYSWAYERMKKTPIIKALRNIFFALATFFLFFAFLPIFKMLNFNRYLLLISTGNPFFTAIVAVCLHGFYFHSRNAGINKKLKKPIRSIFLIAGLLGSATRLSIV